MAKKKITIPFGEHTAEYSFDIQSPMLADLIPNSNLADVVHEEIKTMKGHIDLRISQLNGGGSTVDTCHIQMEGDVWQYKNNLWKGPRLNLLNKGLKKEFKNNSRLPSVLKMVGFVGKHNRFKTPTMEYVELSKKWNMLLRNLRNLQIDDDDINSFDAFNFFERLKKFDQYFEAKDEEKRHTLKVEFSDLSEDDMKELQKMIHAIEWSGAVGASRGFKVFCDGDGSFRTNVKMKPEISKEGAEKAVDEYDKEKMQIGLGT